MAPTFFSRLVKNSQAPTPSSSNGSSPKESQVLESSHTPSTTGRPHSRTISHPPSAHLSPRTFGDETPDSMSERGSVKIGIIPPSPRMIHADFSEFAERLANMEPVYQETLQHRRARSQDRAIPDRHAVSLAARSTGEMVFIVEDMMPTPTANRSNNVGHDWSSTISDGSPRSSRQLTPASSTGNLRGFVDKHGSRSPSLQTPDRSVKRKSSFRSQTQPSPPLNIDQGSKADTPDVSRQGRHEDGAAPQSNYIVESPTAVAFQKGPSQELLGTFSDVDATSLRSATSSTSKNKKGWRRPSISTPSRKPTGVATALATSGLAMANATSQVPPVPVLPSSSSRTTLALNGNRPREGTMNSRTRVQHAASSSVHSMTDAGARSRNISLSKSDFSDGDAFHSSEEDSGSDDELDLNVQDIPVTGFAVASNKRNADFHELFPSIPEGDYLIEDYGCALQREILIQGRLYISENHICFHANIFGWITDLSIPIYEITGLEKKMTAFVIPNAIQITTRQAKYTFASFLSRDTTYDVIANIWRLALPEDNLELPGSHNASSRSMISTLSVSDEAGKEATPGASVNKVTRCSCSKNDGHLSEVALETVLPGTPDKIYNLMFASGFIKDFMKVDQKLIDVQISDWAPISQGSKLLQRNMSYIKPLYNSVGPKQTKCEIHDESVYCDFEDHAIMLTTTKTPDVPSGGVFAVMTRTCLMWASSISTRVIVTTQVEWTGRSFIKGLIEKSAIEGQKVYHSDLDKAMRMYIQEHQSEFIPEGIDPTAVAPVEPITPVADHNGGLEGAISGEEARKARERDRNRRGLQWAYDTFDGAYNVAKRSTIGALELVREAWDQSSSTTVLWFVIVLLVFSNLWTLVLVGNREEVGRRKEAKRAEEKEKWVQGVVAGIWEEMAGERIRPGTTSPVPSGPVSDLQAEVANIGKALDGVEARVRALRESLDSLS